LRAVPPALRVPPIAKRIVVGDLPERRLRAVALPVGRIANSAIKSSHRKIVWLVSKSQQSGGHLPLRAFAAAKK
jgi:hypothetical protein